MKLFNAGKIKYVGVMAVLCGFVYTNALHAQDDIEQLAETVDEQIVEIVKLPQPPASDLKPMFWNLEELSIINQIKRGVIQVVPIDESALMGTLVDDVKPEVAAPVMYMVPRDLRLSGMVYNTDDDWSLWINGVKVTPDKPMKEIHQLNVYSDYIELKWFDATTNKIYPVRMRPNQRFNIDTGRFLPL